MLGAFYLRLVGTPADIYQYLEPLYNDYRKIRLRLTQGMIRFKKLLVCYHGIVFYHGCRKGAGERPRHCTYVGRHSVDYICQPSFDWMKCRLVGWTTVELDGMRFVGWATV